MAITLSIVAAATVLFRQSMIHLIESRAALLDKTSRAIEASAGLLLTLVAVRELILK
ncbi:hypothetical protein [Hankyongella ginsenosidimutans]|uniref:hypothetical protein n=1 Tax=Hankyongella ginsenosidimutans TaxID=1763828 RepID=UPI001CA34EAE|nr:hypothetical protein [Hankyongella ginsenosidimutans]